MLPGISPGLVLSQSIQLQAALSCCLVSFSCLRSPTWPHLGSQDSSELLGIFRGQGTGCLVPGSAAPWLLGHRLPPLPCRTRHSRQQHTVSSNYNPATGTDPSGRGHRAPGCPHWPFGSSATSLAYFPTFTLPTSPQPPAALAALSRAQCLGRGGHLQGSSCPYVPDIALMSFLLFGGTFLCCTTLKHFKSSRYFPTRVSAPRPPRWG